MPELDLRNNPWGKDGYGYDPRDLEKELYYLAAIFGASKKISTLKESPKKDAENMYSISSVFREIEYAEIQQKILLIAITCRNEIENKNHFAQNNKNKIVGTILFPPRKTPNNLLFLEACHKIIHGNSLNFDLSKNKNIRSGYLLPYIYIYGEKNGKEWKVKIDIFKFIKTAFNLIY